MKDVYSQLENIYNETIRHFNLTASFLKFLESVVDCNSFPHDLTASLGKRDTFGLYNCFYYGLPRGSGKTKMFFILKKMNIPDTGFYSVTELKELVRLNKAIPGVIVMDDITPIDRENVKNLLSGYTYSRSTKVVFLGTFK